MLSCISSSMDTFLGKVGTVGETSTDNNKLYKLGVFADGGGGGGQSHVGLLFRRFKE